ncbi:MAG TPA: methyltransferase domain-containing protein [Conexibacter sp.]|nr:methyltransferase domain-containing protein [Conexibacter sp.]
MANHEPDDRRISRRSLLRLQLARWADPVTGAVHAGLPLRAPAPVVAALVELAEVEAGMQVLDLGTGDVARTAVRGADVTASDADARDLPYVDGAFDVVLSACRTAPAAGAARELVRVTCPGGVVALALRDSEETVRGRLGGLLDELETRASEAGWLLVRGRRAIPQA